MSHPDYVPGHKFKLSVYASTDSPGAATFVCGITSQSVNLSAAAIEAPSRDCSNPTAGVLMRRAPGVESMEISGSGQYVKTAYATLIGYFRSGKAENWMIERMQTIAGVETVQETWAGAFVMTALNIDAPADGQNFATLSITLASDGVITFTPAV